MGSPGSPGTRATEPPLWGSLSRMVLIEPRTYPRRNISNLVNSRSHKSFFCLLSQAISSTPVAEPREVVHVRVNFAEAFSQMGLLDTQTAKTVSFCWYFARIMLR